MQTQLNSVTTGLVLNKTSEKSTILITDSPLITRLKKMKRTVITTSRIIQEGLTNSRMRFKVAMVTLTYRDDVDWDSRHVSSYIDSVRKWAKRRGIQVRYVWVMELTKRGRPHYHILWWLPKGVTMPMADKQGWWKHGFTNSVWARKPVGYIAKYASKGLSFDNGDVHSLPKGARICGYGGLDLPMKDEKAWVLCPTWLKELLSNEKFSVRKKGSLWVVEKAFCYSSPWFYDFITRSLSWRGYQPIREYLDVFPDYSFSDFKFIADPAPIEPAHPKYLINAISDRLSFQDAVANIEITGYYDAIDASILQCTLKS